MVTQLSAITPPGSASAQGSLIFGIGTQPNNQLGSVIMLAADPSGEITTNYQNVDYPGTFLDSGSNGFFFLNPTRWEPRFRPVVIGRGGIARPRLRLSPSQIKASPGASSSATFTISNADQLFQSPNNTAVPTLGGNWPLSPLVFDLGLPFFYGRTVYTKIGGLQVASNGGFAY